MDGLTEYCLQAIGNASSPDDVLEAYLEYEIDESTLPSKLSHDLEQALLDKMKDKFKSIAESHLFRELDKNQIISLVQKFANRFES